MSSKSQYKTLVGNENAARYSNDSVLQSSKKKRHQHHHASSFSFHQSSKENHSEKIDLEANPNDSFKSNKLRTDKISANKIYPSSLPARKSRNILGSVCGKGNLSNYSHETNSSKQKLNSSKFILKRIMPSTSINDGFCFNSESEQNITDNFAILSHKQNYQDLLLV
jgi:hypothetical protein